MKKYSQTTAVIDHLERSGSITSIEAFSEYGITRLSAIIFNLRKKGYNIISEEIKHINRYDRTIYFARYILKEK